MLMAFSKKITSARWLITLFILLTYCVCIIGMLYLVFKKIMTMSEFLGVFTGVSLLTREIYEKYFNRDDRGKEVTNSDDASDNSDTKKVS